MIVGVVACLGAYVLIYTGLALAFRRLIPAPQRFIMIGPALVALPLFLSAPAASTTQPHEAPATRPSELNELSEAELEAAKAAFAEGVIAMEAGDSETAEAAFSRVVAIDPHAANAWANLGMLRQELGRPAEALEALDRLLTSEPENVRAHAVRAQLLHALERPAEAQAAVDRVMQLHAQGKTEGKRFAREQLTVSEQPLVVFQYYELTGDRAVRYVFYLLDEQGKLNGRYSLGSYAFTNEMSRAAGDIGPDERLFHLDYYGPDGGHKTYGFYKNEPPYTLVRQDVRRAILGEDEPVSGTTPEGDIELNLPATRPADGRQR